MTWSWASLATWCCLMSHALLLVQKLSCMQQRESHGDHCKKAVQDFEARRVLALQEKRSRRKLKTTATTDEFRCMRSWLQVQNWSTLAQTTTSLTRRSVVSTAQSNWCGGCWLLIPVAGIAYQIAVPCSLIHGHWLCVWNAMSSPQVTTRAGHNVTTDRLPRAGLCRPLRYVIFLQYYRHTFILVWHFICSWCSCFACTGYHCLIGHLCCWRSLELHLTTSELWFGQEQEGILP